MQFFLKYSLTAIFIVLMISMSAVAQGVDELPSTFLMQSDNSVVYDMSMSYKNYYGSGLLVLKRESKSNYHGVFLSKVGLKLMEFKIVSGEFEWVKLLEYIDKKATRKVLERDFSMLMLSDIDAAIKVKKLKTKEGLKRFKLWSARKLIIGVNEGAIETVENRGGVNFAKTKITFEYDKESTPKSVSLTHRTIKVKLQLELLEQ